MSGCFKQTATVVLIDMFGIRLIGDAGNDPVHIPSKAPSTPAFPL